MRSFSNFKNGTAILQVRWFFQSRFQAPSSSRPLSLPSLSEWWWWEMRGVERVFLFWNSNIKRKQSTFAWESLAKCSSLFMVILIYFPQFLFLFNFIFYPTGCPDSTDSVLPQISKNPLSTSIQATTHSQWTHQHTSCNGRSQETQNNVLNYPDLDYTGIYKFRMRQSILSQHTR